MKIITLLNIQTLNLNIMLIMLTYEVDQCPVHVSS